MTSRDEESRSANRPKGTVDEDANPPLSDPDDDTVHGGAGTIPPQDTGSAIPPYDGRQTSAKSDERANPPARVAGTRRGEDKL